MSTPGVPDVAKQRVTAKWTKIKSCGAVGAYDLLKDVRSNKDAFFLVRSVFEDLAEKSGYAFKHWKTGVPVTATQALMGDMLLLWMRHTDNQQDVLRWLKSQV